MRKTKYPVRLSDKERNQLLQIVRKGKTSAQIMTRVQILLALDENAGKPPKQAEIAERYHTSDVTIFNTIRRYTSDGIDAVINRKKREKPPVLAKITGEIEARLIAMACSEPPEGYSRWSLVLLRDEAIRIGLIDHISSETIRKALKKRI